MKFRSGREEEIIDLNISSMIDMTFLLLIYFIVMFARRQDERELKVPIPAEAAVQQVEKITEAEDVIVDVQPDGTILYNSSLYDEGREDSSDLPELLGALKDARDENSKQSVVIRGERETLHKRIVAVLNACSGAGIEKISFPADANVFEE